MSYKVTAATDISRIKCIFSFVNFTKHINIRYALSFCPCMFLLRAHSEKYPVYRKSNDRYSHKETKGRYSFRMCARQILSNSRASPFLPFAKPVARPCSICARWPSLSSLLIATQCPHVYF